MKGAVYRGLLLFALLGSQPAWATSRLLPVRAFGFPETAAANPQAELIESTNGILYGSTVGGANDQGAIFQVNKNGTDFRVLKRFGESETDGKRPSAAVIEATDGRLYGTTVTGGNSNLGTIYRLAKDGSEFSILQHFAGTNGAFPEARLLEASDGLLYGCTSGGGTNDFGVLFSISKAGTDFTVLHRFSGTNGANPEAGLLQAGDGALYGTTYSGGSSNLGTVYRINTNGTGFAVLKSFITAYSTNGHSPLCRLAEGTNGMLYGTTSGGGTNSSGTIFALSKDGLSFSTLRSCSPTDGQIPLAGLTSTGNGWLYGATSTGGSNGLGVIFRLAEEGGSFSVLTNLVSALGSSASLLLATDGAVYGTALSGGAFGQGAVFSLARDGGQFRVLHHLHESGGDGTSSTALVTPGAGGWFYGTTRRGGTNGLGTVFAVNPNTREYRTLWTFDGLAGGSAPSGGLTMGTNGLLYGTSEFVLGSLFCLDLAATGFNTIYSFASSNGVLPRTAPVQADDGFLYGTAMLRSGPLPGVVYRVSPAGSNYTVLRQFSIAAGDGLDPMQPLIQGRDRLLYGTAPYGSVNGTIFKLGTSGSGYTVLKNFATTSQGANPLSPLLQASDAMLYGTTYGGGNSNNAGVVFRINTNGTGFQVLRTFVGTAGDGRHPCGGMIETSEGAIYGTTERGGVDDCGTIFKLNKDGSGYSVVASFDRAIGRHPRGGLVIGPDGAFYGTTEQAGDLGFGSVFRYGPAEIITDFRLTGAQPKLTCLGLPGTNYWIERSTNLLDTAGWTVLVTTNAPPNGAFLVVDESNIRHSAYYRLRR